MFNTVLSKEEMEMKYISYKLVKGHSRSYIGMKNIYQDDFFPWLMNSLLRFFTRFFSNILNLTFIVVYIVHVLGKDERVILQEKAYEILLLFNFLVEFLVYYWFAWKKLRGGAKMRSASYTVALCSNVESHRSSHQS